MKRLCVLFVSILSILALISCPNPSTTSVENGNGGGTTTVDISTDTLSYDASTQTLTASDSSAKLSVVVGGNTYVDTGSVDLSGAGLSNSAYSVAAVTMTIDGESKTENYPVIGAPGTYPSKEAWDAVLSFYNYGVAIVSQVNSSAYTTDVQALRSDVQTLISDAASFSYTSDADYNTAYKAGTAPNSGEGTVENGLQSSTKGLSVILDNLDDILTWCTENESGSHSSYVSAFRSILVLLAYDESSLINSTFFTDDQKTEMLEALYPNLK